MYSTAIFATRPYLPLFLTFVQIISYNLTIRQKINLNYLELDLLDVFLFILICLRIIARLAAYFIALRASFLLSYITTTCIPFCYFLRSSCLSSL